MTLTHDSRDHEIDKYWENYSRSKWGTYITDVEKRVLLKAINLAKDPATALDVGCGGGRWSRLLIDLGWRVVCTDVNPMTLALCQRNIPTAKCILVDAKDTTLPCETSSQALILGIEVIMALWNDWFIAESFRVLRPGGFFVGVFENRRSLRGYYRHLKATAKGEFDYYKMAYPDWRVKFCQQGFNLIYEEGICWFPFSRSSNSPLVPILTRLERRLGLRRLPSLSPWIVFLAQKEANDRPVPVI